MTTRLGRFAFGPSKRRERHEIARGKQSPIKTTTFFAQIDGRLIVRCLSVLEEVMTKYAHPPLFQLVSWLEDQALCCRLPRFNSLIRRLFVSGSHVGCMSAAIRLLRFGVLHLIRSKTAIVIRKRANPHWQR